MVEETGVVFDEKLVGLARVNFNADLNKGYRRRNKASFDVLLDYFKRKSPQIKIAEEIGVTRERVRQIYNKYFRKVFGNKSGRLLLKEKFEKEKALKEVEFLDGPTFKPIIDMAKAEGYKVRAVSHRQAQASGFYANKIMINGCLCSVHKLSNLFSPKESRVKYCRVSSCKKEIEKSDFLIFYFSVEGFPERVFIVPSTSLKEEYCSPSKKSSCMFYLPTEKLPVYNNHHPKIDWWKYENAWHLLS